MPMGHRVSLKREIVHLEANLLTWWVDRVDSWLVAWHFPHTTPSISAPPGSSALARRRVSRRQRVRRPPLGSGDSTARPPLRRISSSISFSSLLSFPHDFSCQIHAYLNTRARPPFQAWISRARTGLIKPTPDCSFSVARIFCFFLSNLLWFVLIQQKNFLIFPLTVIT